MTDAPRERPLSPHLMTGGLGSPALWRWHVTMLTSILHRVTGVGLYVGALILSAWLVALAMGDGPYGEVMGLLGSPLGKVILFGLTLSVFFHLAKGVQHLIWDLGMGFKLPSANLGAMICMAFSVAAALVIWTIAGLAGAL